MLGLKITPKNSTLWRVLPLGGAAALLTIALYLFGSCSSEEGEPRQIEGHTLIKEGIPHGAVASKAERYCVSCHGVNLTGGEGLEPSCYTCHGKNWLDNPGAQSEAGSDHSTINEGYHHHPAQFTPMGTCSTCHGTALEGVSDNGAAIPSCTLCHVKLWEEGAP